MGFEMTFKGDFEWENLEEDLRENFGKNSKGSLRRYSDGKEMLLKRERLGGTLAMDLCTPTQNPKPTKELQHTPTNNLHVCNDLLAS